MAASQVGRYRLEIAVKRIYGLVNMSSSARILFSVRLSNFPDVFIRPHLSGSGGAVEMSPEKDYITSLTYGVCHKAEFRLNDEECRTMFPAQCLCSLYDEGHGPAVSAAGKIRGAPAALNWVCPCPLTVNNAVLGGLQYASYPMCDVSGQTMGFAEMLCRVIFVENIPPATAAAVSALAVPNQASMTTPSGYVTVNGKPYVIRVIVSGKTRTKAKENGKKREKTTSQDRKSVMQGTPEKKTEAGVVVAIDGDSQDNKNSELQKSFKRRQRRNHHCSDKDDKTIDTKKDQLASSEKKDTLLYRLQYDVAYQMQSNSGILYTMLKREFTPLNRVAVNERAKSMMEKIDSHVQTVLKLANIALQLVNQLLDEAGEMRSDVPLDEKGPRNPVNKLPLAEEGSVAHFLVYHVLFQLQCLGTNLFHLTAVYRRSLDVPLSSLSSQHVKFITKLSLEVQQLTRCINIIVQSAIDGSFGKADALSTTVKTSYSSTTSSSSSSSTISSSNDGSSNSSSSRSTTAQRSSSVESLSSASTRKNETMTALPTSFTPSVSHPSAFREGGNSAANATRGISSPAVENHFAASKLTPVPSSLDRGRPPTSLTTAIGHGAPLTSVEEGSFCPVPTFTKTVSMDEASGRVFDFPKETGSSEQKLAITSSQTQWNVQPAASTLSAAQPPVADASSAPTPVSSLATAAQPAVNIPGQSSYNMSSFPVPQAVQPAASTLSAAQPPVADTSTAPTPVSSLATAAQPAVNIPGQRESIGASGVQLPPSFYSGVQLSATGETSAL